MVIRELLEACVDDSLCFLLAENRDRLIYGRS